MPGAYRTAVARTIFQSAPPPSPTRPPSDLTARVLGAITPRWWPRLFVSVRSSNENANEMTAPAPTRGGGDRGRPPTREEGVVPTLSSRRLSSHDRCQPWICFSMTLISAVIFAYWRARASRLNRAAFRSRWSSRPAETFAAIHLASFRNRCKKIDPPVSRITLDRNYVRYPLIGCLLVRRRRHIHRVADLGGDLQAQAYKGAARNASITIQSAFTTAHPHVNMP